METTQLIQIMCFCQKRHSKVTGEMLQKSQDREDINLKQDK